MKNMLIQLIVLLVCGVSWNNGQAQAFRSSATEVLENSNSGWVEKKLPASLITFTDYAGEVNIKFSLPLPLIKQDDSSSLMLNKEAKAVFVMPLDKSIFQEQSNSEKINNSNGMLTLNGISKKIPAEYTLAYCNCDAARFNLSINIRFNPADFIPGPNNEVNNEPVIVRINNGYLNKYANNF